MYIDIGYGENKHRHIVYIHIYSWNMDVHPPALSCKYTKTLKSTHLVSNLATTSILNF